MCFIQKQTMTGLEGFASKPYRAAGIVFVFSKLFVQEK
jgi:hypothetical protein